MSVRRSYTVTEQSKYGRTLTISESDIPNTIAVSLHNAGEDGNDRQTQMVYVSRDDWEEIARITGRYGSGFTWAEKPDTTGEQ